MPMPIGSKHSEEAKKKMSETHLFIAKNNPEIYYKQRLPKSSEFKKKVSDKLKGRIFSEETLY